MRSSNQEEMTIMPGTISLAHNLKFKLIAQGIETDLHRLLSGCSPLGEWILLRSTRKSSQE